MKLATTILLFFAFVCAAFCDDDPRTTSSHFFEAFYGKSMLIFGSEDERFGGGFGYGYGRPEPKFTLWHVPAQLNYEAYVDHTQTTGHLSRPADSTFAGGVLGFARWRWPVNKAGMGFYMDFGWGFQYANQTTLDLDSVVNSTPLLGIGESFKIGTQEYLVGLRVLHISDAGLKGKNFGQNELYLTLGLRF